MEASAWDACANPRGGVEPEPDGERFNPFLSHAFLSALEDSGSVGKRTGWNPVHLLVEGQGGGLAGVAAAYVKSHSQGEYVFDHGWADAYQRAGGDYYPKIQVAVPFTPVTGRRLLVAADAPAERTRDALLAGFESLRNTVEASSVHFTFLTKGEWDALGAQGYLQRTDQQFQFRNEGYAGFDDFLAALASRKRKVIKRERKDALAEGLTIDWITGSDLTEDHWDAFWAFYKDTGSRKWGRPYLTRAFFSLVGERMRDRVLLVMAKRNGRYVAGAINFIGDDALYGRNWGCIEEHPVPALRGLLLSGDRVRPEPRSVAGRGRRPGGAQARPRLSGRPPPTRPIRDCRQAPRARGRRDYLEAASGPTWSRRSRSTIRTRRSARKSPRRARRSLSF